MTGEPQPVSVSSSFDGDNMRVDVDMGTLFAGESFKLETFEQRQVAKDRKWIQMCVDGAQRFSTCGRRQYFAIIVDLNGHVLGTGYNGGPSGTLHCNEGGCPRLYSDSAPGVDYTNCIAIHAEANALLHSDYITRQLGGTLYVNGAPCSDCAKLIANSGLRRLVYLDDGYRPGPGLELLKRVGFQLVAL